MNGSSFDTRYTTILIFVMFISTLWLQACETIYTSSIIIPKDMESISQNVEKSQKQNYLAGVFDQYCRYEEFQLDPNVEPLQGGKSANESRIQLKKCRAKWFYFAGLSSQQTEYKIELFLMQPWSLWSSGKQERFFCRETSDMFDFIKTRLKDEKVTYKPYARYPQNKVQ